VDQQEDTSDGHNLLEQRMEMKMLVETLSLLLLLSPSGPTSASTVGALPDL
jgi:hypothetical protein